MQKEKIQQAVALLKEKEIDLWMTVVRETLMLSDPVLPLLSTSDFTGTTAVCICRNGRVAVLVDSLDAEGVRQAGLYQEVIAYQATFDRGLQDLLEDIRPRSIALNYSPADHAADGLSHGLYLRIKAVLDRMGYEGEVLSAAAVVSALRGRKTAEEVEKVRRAAATADSIFSDARRFIRAGVTEKDIYDFFFERMAACGVKPSWEAGQCPAVFTGPISTRGHSGPTDRTVQPGHVVCIDFGVLQDDYCSDLQRSYYVLEEGEIAAPHEVQRAFDTLQEAIRRAARFMKPGVTGCEVDKVARDYVVSQGYPSWDYSLGHQVGRDSHDGGTYLGKRDDSTEYPELVDTPLEEGNIFTLEPGVPTAHGWVQLEEMVCVRRTDVAFLVPMQADIYLV